MLWCLLFCRWGFGGGVFSCSRAEFFFFDLVLEFFDDREARREVVVDGVFCFLECLFEGGSVEFVSDDDFSLVDEACFFEDVEVEESVEVVVHCLSFDSCVECHFFDGHQSEFRFLFSEALFFLFVHFENDGVDVRVAVFFFGCEPESCGEDFCEFCARASWWGFVVVEFDDHCVLLRLESYKNLSELSRRVSGFDRQHIFEWKL